MSIRRIERKKKSDKPLSQKVFIVSMIGCDFVVSTIYIHCRRPRGLTRLSVIDFVVSVGDFYRYFMAYQT